MSYAQSYTKETNVSHVSLLAFLQSNKLICTIFPSWFVINSGILFLFPFKLNGIYSLGFFLFFSLGELVYITNFLRLYFISNLRFNITVTLCFAYSKRNLFEMLLNQTEIRFYFPCTNWFGTIRTSAWFHINWIISNKIWFRYDLIIFRKDFSVCRSLRLSDYSPEILGVFLYVCWSYIDW